ncbi:MAG: tRNA pseudouridine(55) synthase TruB [Chlamydiae bacterium]|nr:tRNA pseudouridine(55) synthase TruB [Chlamydiota bacterium]
MNLLQSNETSGILLVNKTKGKTSFSLVAMLRRMLNVKKIGHAGTLDPFATGVMVMLIGKKYTRMSDQFLCENKEYEATMRLGVETDTYDCEGKVVSTSDIIPSIQDLEKVIEKFQGDIEQIPPMFSAKKIKGKKLYELAREGKEIERKPSQVHVKISLIDYQYPFAKIHVCCSKGTYIRSLAHDIGKGLGSGAHLTDLHRTRSGQFSINKCIDGLLLQDTINREQIQAALLSSAELSAD